ncbi:MAG: hypothetical protein ACYCZO_11880 [Daejeonella sp.]
MFDSTRHLIPKGKEVDAIDGDWIMKNDKVIVVIGKVVPGRNANQMVPHVQGAFIDFTSLTANDDNLFVYYLQSLGVNIMSANEMVILKNKGKIELKVKRHPTDENPWFACAL